jgi:hypothetical protein
MLAVLRLLPTVCKLQRDGLIAHYGLQGGPGIAFFESFGYQASTHATTLSKLLTIAIADDEDAAAAAQESASLARRALEDMLTARTPVA